MDILFFSALTNFLYYCAGNLVLNKKENDFHSQFYIYFVGVILMSAISLILNFFIKLSPTLNTITYSTIIFLFIVKTKFSFNKENLKFLFLSSCITFSLIIFSNINRPDAGLYHLPFTNVLNEHKIIFGLSNIHFRFGTASIMQYLSAINYNFIFKDIGITIPLASIVTFFIIYFFNTVFRLSKNLKNITNENIFCLFIIIFISYKINRYSSFGNDAVGHLTLFYLTSKVLNEKKINLSFVTLIAVFAFLNKTTMIFVLLFPILFFFKSKI